MKYHAPMHPLLAVPLSLAFTVALAVIVLYGFHRAWCAYIWWQGRTAKAATGCALPIFPGQPGSMAPRVTVQLPMYNEPFVAERVIRAVGNLDWPRDRLQVQVIDDSTDHTTSIINLCCRELRGEGLNIQHIRRPERQGYKAGALLDAMPHASGTFIAIFDADFVPEPDFLQRTLPAFCDESVGLAQACWSHLNETLSPLTRAQAMLLDGHFFIEHAARNMTGRWFNFNGTAGVWRRRAIDSSGSWQSDTLIEDVDLSYRAQLGGWRFVLLPEVRCAAELPCRMGDLRAQQWRWTAGSVMAARKLLRWIWRVQEPWQRQYEATVHLLGPTVHAALLIMAIMLGPMLWLLGNAAAVLLLGLIFAAVVGGAAAFYLAGAAARNRPLGEAAKQLPLLLMLAVGLSVNNTAAAVAALLNRAGGFNRTPKLLSVGRQPDWRRRASELGHDSGESAEPTGWAGDLLRRLDGLTELGLAAWCGTWAVICLAWWATWWAAPLLGLFAAGFGWVGVVSLRDAAFAGDDAIDAVEANAGDRVAG